MKNPATIYCLGDSHCNFFSGQDTGFVAGSEGKHVFPFFKVYHLGPILAYNLVKTGSTTGGREKLFATLKDKVPPGARVLLSFGEIDCRAHLIKQAEQTGQPLEAIVKQCLDRYFVVIEEVRALGYTVIVYNAPPSSLRPNFTNYPSYGSAVERNHVTRLFNADLGARCAAAGIYFLHTFPDIVRWPGASTRRCFFDHIHISQRAMPATLRRLAEMFPGEDFSAPAYWRRTLWLARLLPRYRLIFSDATLAKSS